MEKDLPKEANIDHKGEERVAEGIIGELHIIAGVFNLLQVRHYKEDFRKQRHQLKTFSRFTKKFLEFAQYGSFCMFIKTCVYPARPCNASFLSWRNLSHQVVLQVVFIEVLLTKTIRQEDFQDNIAPLLMFCFSALPPPPHRDHQ